MIESKAIFLASEVMITDVNVNPRLSIVARSPSWIWRAVFTDTRTIQIDIVRMAQCQQFFFDLVQR